VRLVLQQAYLSCVSRPEHGARHDGVVRNNRVRGSLFRIRGQTSAAFGSLR
jgi:hypothetical protein